MQFRQYSCTDIAALLSPISHRPILTCGGLSWPTSHVAVRRWHKLLVLCHSSFRHDPNANLAGEKLSPISRWPPPPNVGVQTRGSINLSLIHIGALNSSGFMLILQSFATQPLNWRNVWTPSNIRIWVNPISLINSSFECSDKTGMLLVTLNIVLMISCDE
jgi:hypothetical protein